MSILSGSAMMPFHNRKVAALLLHQYFSCYLNLNFCCSSPFVSPNATTHASILPLYPTNIVHRDSSNHTVDNRHNMRNGFKRLSTQPLRIPLSEAGTGYQIWPVHIWVDSGVRILIPEPGEMPCAFLTHESLPSIVPAHVPARVARA
jgi:hypothetical protein